MKTMILGYDGSAGSERALERAAELATALGATVVITTVVGTAVTDAALTAPDVVAVPLSAVEQDAHERAERKRLLEHGRSYLADRGVAAEVAEPAGDAADEILAVAEAREADLIIVGTHEPGLLERLFRGGVSEAVARKASCDVLVVHPEHSGRRSS